MYRDSQHGPTIDISGPDGNAYALMGYAQHYAKQLGLDGAAIVEKMMSGDYENLIAVFKKEFPVINIIGEQGEDE